MMLKGAGIEVYDIGVDVSPQAFADKAEEVGADHYTEDAATAAEVKKLLLAS
ncbi:MAG: hypothetical protein ACREVX_05805 [Clostridium sp.]|uniref:hypothetical protein n=1 Tax=Clostridium sp. TaxID=1506 RepID=UPI003D6C7A96